MGAPLAGRVRAAGRRSHRRNGRRAPMSDINVTPFVDVMLVLLIIFMVTAPLLTVGVQVDLPETTAAPITGQDEPLVVSVAEDGTLYLMDEEIARDSLVPKLTAVTQAKPGQRIFVRGDAAIPYGAVMEVMGMINAAGFPRVALVAQLPAKER